MSLVKVVSSVTEMQNLSFEWCFSSNVALVPTMGFLHEGHLTLVREAVRRSDVVIVSIFVNPLQFGPKEDLSTYPRDFDRDLELLAEAGANIVFAPLPEEITPASMTTTVDPGVAGTKLCGFYRPGHFTGVCTIVAKLFNLVKPGRALFGWKDAQQFLILQKMVRDLELPVELEPLETKREIDGLAMSSRNSYLSAEQRAAAPAIYHGLRVLADLYNHQTDVTSSILRERFMQELAKEPMLKVQYIEIVSMDRLEPVDMVQAGNTLIAAAVLAGKTRLIDNIRL